MLLWPLERRGVVGGSCKQLPGLNTWVHWGEKLGVGVLCTGRDLVSLEGRCLAVTPERGPSAFPFCPFQRKSRRYYPTRLAINLSSGVSGAGGTAHQPGFIVVETNYRLYAYTGESAEGPWESRLGMRAGRAKEAGRNARIFLVYLIVYRVSDISLCT